MAKKKAPALPEHKATLTWQEYFRQIQMTLAEKLAAYVKEEGQWGFDVGDFTELQRGEVAARVIWALGELADGRDTAVVTDLEVEE